MATRRRGKGDEDDFAAFWAQHGTPPETKRILGVDVVVPTDVPLSFEDRVDELQESKSREDLEELLEILFGEGTITQWKANGCTTAQYRVLLTWGLLNAQKGPTTFEKAFEATQKAEQAVQAKAEQAVQAVAEGKAPAPNRATRRAAASSKTAASARAGRTSSRISAANTRSRGKS